MQINTESDAEDFLSKFNELYADLDSLFFSITEDTPKTILQTLDWREVTDKLNAIQQSVREIEDNFKRG